MHPSTFANLLSDVKAMISREPSSDDEEEELDSNSDVVALSDDD